MAENNNSPKRKKPVKVSFGISWLYIILLIGIGYMFFNQGGTANPQKEEWAEVCQQWLDGDIKEVVFIRNEYEGRIVVGKLDVDENPETCEEYGIMNIPTMLFFNNGELVNRHVGACRKQELAQIFDSLL